MSGPAASVVFAQPLTAPQRKQLDVLSVSLTDNLEVGDGPWFFNLRSTEALGAPWPYPPEHRPPLSLHLQDITAEHSPEDVAYITQITGRHAREELVICAHTNEPSSHHALGVLTHHVARTYQGIIDLGGALDGADFTVYRQGAHDADMEFAIALYEAYFAGHPGQLWPVPYTLSDGALWFSHFCDADFMAWWLRQPQFRMVK